MHSGSDSSNSNSGAVASSSRDHAVQLLEQRLAAIVEDLIRRRLREVLASMSPTELADVLNGHSSSGIRRQRSSSSSVEVLLEPHDDDPSRF